MTNLHILFDYYNVHSHNQKLVKELLTKHLPSKYTPLVVKRLAEQGIEVDAGQVRNVKCGRTKDLKIYEAIINLAQEQKRIADALNDSLQEKQTA